MPYTKSLPVAMTILRMGKLYLRCMIVPPAGSHGRPRGKALRPPMTAQSRIPPLLLLLLPSVTPV